jgi:hypothetical protein
MLQCCACNLLVGNCSGAQVVQMCSHTVAGIFTYLHTVVMQE